MKWTDSEIELSIDLLEGGRSFREVAEIIKRTPYSVESKMKRLKVRSGYLPGSNKGDSKYSEYNWVLIQEEYDSGLSQEDIVKKHEEFVLSGLYWGVVNKKLKTRNLSDALKLSWVNGKYGKSNKSGIVRYRQLCEFKFNVFDFPNRFDTSLIEKYGMYKAKNRGDNPEGISRDHMYSVKDGYLNGVDPHYVSHPANCELMKHDNNKIKHSKSSISLNELYFRVDNW